MHEKAAVMASLNDQAKMESEAFCVACDGNHAQVKALKRGPQYEYFHAARDGCVPCVKRIIAEGKIDLMSASLTQGYNARQWAEWGLTHGYGRGGADHIAVLTLLDTWMSPDDARVQPEAMDSAMDSDDYIFA